MSKSFFSSGEVISYFEHLAKAQHPLKNEAEILKKIKDGFRFEPPKKLSALDIDFQWNFTVGVLKAGARYQNSRAVFAETATRKYRFHTRVAELMDKFAEIADKKSEMTLYDFCRALMEVAQSAYFEFGLTPVNGDAYWHIIVDNAVHRVLKSISLPKRSRLKREVTKKNKKIQERTVRNFTTTLNKVKTEVWAKTRKKAAKEIVSALEKAAKNGHNWLCIAPEGRWVMTHLCYGGKLNSYVYSAEWGGFFITAKTVNTSALRSHFRDLGFVIDYADENEPSSWFYIKTSAA